MIQAGDIVLFHGHESHGVRIHPAMVTRVINPGLVNVTVLPDLGQPKHFAMVPVLAVAADHDNGPFHFVTAR